jgi:DNA-binding beta-propeller fold protein YncE
MAAKQSWIRLGCAVALATVTTGPAAPSAVAEPATASTSSTSTESPAFAAYGPRTGRFLYAVNQAAAIRGSISVYDIGAGHHLIKTIETVRDVDDVKGVAASTATGRLYVAYRTRSGVGMIYCLNVYDDTVLWNRTIDPDIDRLAIHPDGQLLYVPTWEGGSAHFINVLNASTGDVVRKVYFSNRSPMPNSRCLGRSFRKPRPRTEVGNTSI